MNITSLLKTLGSALLLLGLITATMPSAQAQTKGRPVEGNFQDWLAAQTGQFGFVNDPDINGDGVDDGPRYFVAFDYAHLSAPGIGTVTGTMTTRKTADGREDVTVNIEFQNILLRVWSFENQVFGPQVLGNATSAVLNNGATPALVTGKFTLEFFQDDADDSLALGDVFRRGDWYGFMLNLRGEGPLSAAFDPAVEAGTTGRLVWGKPGLDTPANANADNGAASLYPNDEMHLFPIGRR